MDPNWRFFAFGGGPEPYVPAGFGWMLSVGGSGTDYAYGVDVEGSNIYFCGYLRVGSYDDAYIAKFNTSGVLQWQRKFLAYSNVYAFDVKIDTQSGSGASSDVFVGCYAQGAEPAVAKYNQSGTLQWKERFAVSPTYYAGGLALNSNNAVLCGKISTSYGIGHVCMFSKSNGSDQAEYSHGYGTSSGFTIQSYLDCDAEQSDIFACGSHYVSGGYKGLIARINSNGTINDHQSFPNCLFYGIKYVLESGNARLYVVGKYNSGGAFLFKTNAYGSGNIVWQRRLGTSTQMRWTSVDGDGNDVFCVGHAPSSDGSNYDIVIARYTSGGTLERQMRFASSGHDFAQKIVVDGSFIYIAGQTNNLAAGGGSEMFLLKLNKGLNNTGDLPNGYSLTNESFATASPYEQKTNESFTSTSMNSTKTTWNSTEGAASASTTIKQL